MDSKTSGVFVAKVLVVGSAATGKTSIIRRYTKNEFSSDYQTTIGVDFSLKSLTADGMDINVQLWDVAGQDRFAGLSRIFYTHAVGAIIVFNILERETFDNAVNWKRDIDSKVFLANGDKIPVILLANKSDLVAEGSEPAITSDQIQEFCQQHGFAASFQVSAKTGSNIKDACQALVNSIVANHKRLKQPPKKDDPPADTSSATPAPAQEVPSASDTIKLKADTRSQNASGASSSESKSGGCCS